MTDTALALRGLTRAFGALTAVDALTFDVRPGELFGLVGPDGAGKTTTLRMLAGVLRPTAGDATVGGVSVVRDPEAVKHRIAYMSQRFGLYHDLTVRENIEFYADLYPVRDAARPARLNRSLEGEMLTLRTGDARRALRVLEGLSAVRRAALFGDTIHVNVASRARDWTDVERAAGGGGLAGR